MEQLRQVSKTEKIIFPIVVAIYRYPAAAGHRSADRHA